MIALGRRHKLDIVADILRNATGGTQKTQLVYSSNINFNLLKKYQKILVEKGFIESTNGQIFTTTRGIQFLQKYEELMKEWENLSASGTEMKKERKIILTSK